MLGLLGGMWGCRAVRRVVGRCKKCLDAAIDVRSKNSLASAWASFFRGLVLLTTEGNRHSSQGTLQPTPPPKNKKDDNPPPPKKRCLSKQHV